MIDIHHHLLFGLDDGAKDIETSVAMAEMAAADGITHVVCTPHANSRYHFDPEASRERLEQLRARIGGSVTLGLGCELHLSFDNIEAVLKAPLQYAINQKRYLLVEFPDFSIPERMSEMFYEFLVAGVCPILAHPERNAVILQQPARLDKWMEEGCLTQITASSLTGRFGRESQRFAQKLLDKNKVHFLATDAHNLDSRPPRMAEAFRFVAQHYSEETARRLCVDNPRAAFFGEAISAQPEHETEEIPSAQPGNRGLLARLLKRR